MDFIRKNAFVLDLLSFATQTISSPDLESNLIHEDYEGEQITSKVIMKVKQEIANERVYDVCVMTVEGEGDSFCLESDENGWTSKSHLQI